MNRIIALLIGLMMGAVRCAPANADEMAHADHRFNSGECRTWGSGMYKSATIWVRVFEKYDFTVSNYPIDTQFRFVCQYAGEPDPVSSQPGEYVSRIASNCTAQTKLIDGMPKTFFPTLTGGYSVEYNEGWSYGQTWCKYPKEYYGAPSVPTTMPPMTMTTTTLENLEGP